MAETRRRAEPSHRLPPWRHWQPAVGALIVIARDGRLAQAADALARFQNFRAHFLRPRCAFGLGQTCHARLLDEPHASVVPNDKSECLRPPFDLATRAAIGTLEFARPRLAGGLGRTRHAHVHEVPAMRPHQPEHCDQRESFHGAESYAATLAAQGQPVMPSSIFPYRHQSTACRRSNRGRLHRSKRYLQWQQTAGRELRLQRPAHVPGAVSVPIGAGRFDRRRRDVDHLPKAVLDCSPRAR